VSHELDAEELERQAQSFLKGLSAHLVSLAGTAVPIDALGNAAGPEQFFSYTGFVISYRGLWIYVTAGHVFQQLHNQICQNQIRLVHCHLSDNFGPDAASCLSFPFDFINAKKFVIDNEGEGVDIGLMGITPLYRAAMESKRVLPFVMDGWDNPVSVEFSDYAVLGLPAEHIDQTRRVTVVGEKVIGGVRIAVLFGSRSDAVPRTKPQPRRPWFAIELRDKDQLRSVIGMSGGPMLAFHTREGRRPLYTVVGIQSWWDSERRICFGTPIATVMELLEAACEFALRERETTDRTS